MASSPRRPPPKTDEEAELRLINLAYQRSEELLESGKAPPSMLLHLLKLGSTRATLELEKMKNENMLLAARTDSMESQARSEEKYDKVLDAIKLYTGMDDEEPDFAD